MEETTEEYFRTQQKQLSRGRSLDNWEVGELHLDIEEDVLEVWEGTGSYIVETYCFSEHVTTCFDTGESTVSLTEVRSLYRVYRECEGGPLVKELIVKTYI